MSRAYPIDTRILINGIEAYDRASDLAAGRPTVLDQLSLTWGRSSPVDQPEVGSCQFTMREQLQEPQPERVLARNLAPDPSFEYGTGGFGDGNTNGTVTRDSSRSRTGAISLRFDTTNSGTFNENTVIYGPGSPLRAGDIVTARIWTWTADLASIRVGGNGITGTNSPTFAGPYQQWAPIEVSAPVHTDGASCNVYLYGTNVGGGRVWFDDLSVTVNADPVDFTGDTPAENPGTITPDFHAIAGIPPRARYEAWPALYETPSGAWLLTIKSGSSHMPNTTAYAIIMRSTDEGNTWQRAAAIGADGVSVGGGPVAVAHDGSMTLITTWNTSGEQGINDEFIMYRSVDDGLTWNEQVRYPWPQPATFGHPLTLANGDLLASWHGQGWGMIRSVDNGLTWTLYGTANGGPWAGEGRMVQAPDGTLILIARNNRFDLYYSYDNGLTWTVGVDTDITPLPPVGTNNTFTHAIAINRQWLEMVWHSRDTGKLYYTYADIRELLTDLTAWAPSVELAQFAAAGRGDYGYPTMVRRNNGTLYLAWYADPSRDNTPSIHTGIVRLRHEPGPGDHYRWTGTPGQSPSERFLHPISQTPILDAIHTGSTVAVWARAGDIPPDDDQVMTRTQFREPGPLPTELWNADTSDLEVQVGASFGRQAAWVTRGVEPWAAQLVFPPAEYPPEGFQPDAWDNIPRLLPGQAWQLTVTALLPPGAVAQLTGWAVTDPHKSAPETVCLIEGTPTNTIGLIPGDHQWHIITAMISLPPDFNDPAGAWIVPGIRITTMPSSTTWTEMADTWSDHVRTWADWATIGISEISLHQTASSARDVLVWSGQITGLTAQAAGDHAVTINVNAADPSAPLANETIGDTPWSVQSVGTRVARIMRRARFDYYTAIVDATVADTQLTYRDVDAQPVLGLLHDAATSAGGVLWVAEHATAGTYLWLEDPTQRMAVREFVIDPATGQVTITGTTGASAGGGAVLSAADILRDPLSLAQDTTAVISSVDVGWQEQTTDDDGLPATEDHTVTRTDDNAVDTYGMQKLQIDTELITAADAADLADRHLARARAAGWQFDGVTIDGRVMERPNSDVDDPTRLNTMIDILDGTRRLGLPITILDLPSWMRPGNVASGYLEGGSYTLNDGRWDCDLTVASAATQGMSATWEEMPTTVTWTHMHSDITWAGAYGVTAPTALTPDFEEPA